MTLLIDIGNTRLKWATLERGAFTPGGAVPRRGVAAAATLRETFATLRFPHAVLVANVGGNAAAEEILQVCSQLWSLVPVFAQVERHQLGVTNGYADIRQLGVDRWLALLAAWAGHHQPACIVNCGTATTIDGLDGQGQHVGGLIVPGMELMEKSLVENTSGISTRDGGGVGSGFGRSTEECIRNGAVEAIAALIDRTAARLAADHGGDGLCCIISGGGADRILPRVRRPFERDPELVLRGLALLAGGA